MGSIPEHDAGMHPPPSGAAALPQYACASSSDRQAPPKLNVWAGQATGLTVATTGPGVHAESSAVTAKVRAEATGTS
jgi:hypothetical protein